MQKKPIQLGKGMAALLGNSPIGYKETEHAPIEPKKEIQIETQPMLVDVERIVANKGQPRKIFKEKDLLELSESIKENGIIQPLIVHEKDGLFEIVAGERRFRASKLAGLSKVPVVVKRATKKDVLVM